MAQHTEQERLELLAAVRWPRGVQCPRCAGARISRTSTQEGVRSRSRYSVRRNKEQLQWIPPRSLYQCLDPECRYQFSVKSGTIFSDSHLSLEKWFRAIELMAADPVSILPKTLQTELPVSYQTAWHLRHRINEALGGEGRTFEEALTRLAATPPLTKDDIKVSLRVRRWAWPSYHAHSH